MKKILIAATAAMLVTGAGLFGASAADKLKVGFIYIGYSDMTPPPAKRIPGTDKTVWLEG